MAPLSLSSTSQTHNVPRVVYPTAFTKVRDVLPDASTNIQDRSAMPNAAAEPQSDNLSAYLASLGLEERPRRFYKPDPAPGDLLKLRSPPKNALAVPISPRDIGILGRSQVFVRGNQPVHRSVPAVDPTHINNKGVLALFGILFAGIVISAVWFFLWAKNGGFVFKEGDWEEYKSTVLRRKGPNGTTLSGATKTTDLGQNSIAGSFTEDDGRTEVTQDDNDVRHYRHEKPAQVGGINREPDGSYYDSSAHSETTVGPSVSVAGAAPPAKRGFWLRGGGGKSVPTPSGGIRQVSNSYSFTEGDDATTTISGTEYSDEPVRRPSAPRHSHRSRHSHSRHHNHPDTISEASYMTGDDMETIMESDLGTKIYKHSIPGLLGSSQGGSSQGGSEVSAPRGTSRSGFRRGGGRRRDSLSDSDGETTR